jgi:NADH-quinone oxidoreductase subunit L
MTAFYALRMVGLIFFGSKSERLERAEHEGHHLHEAPRVMWVPYMLLAGASLIIGLVAPLFFEETLRTVLGQHLASAFEIEAHAAEFTLNPVALTGSLAAVAIGGYLGYHFYIARRGDPARVIGTRGVLPGLYRFLENRWYIDALYYKVFVVGMYRGVQALFKWVETGVIDRFSLAGAIGGVGASRASDWFDVHVVDGFMNGVARAGQVFSGAARRVQTGITQSYVFAFAIGIVFLVLLMLLLA